MSNNKNIEIKKAYEERNVLVCFMSKLFPSYIVKHSDENKYSLKGWPYYILIQTPKGQVSWHISETELDKFQHCLMLAENAVKYDGHSTDLKHSRIRELQKEHVVNWKPDLENPHPSLS